jgi:hypothetical protein
MAKKLGYVWWGVYQAAVLETDQEKLPMRIEEARAVMDARLWELLVGQNTKEERLAMGAALLSLRILSLERC